MQNRDVSAFDKSRGIMAYLDEVLPCRSCNRLTNLIWETDIGAVRACTMECAETYADSMKGE